MYWDGTFSLREVDQKFLHGGKVGFGDSYLDSEFRYSKVFTLHAIIHDAVGGVQLQTGKGSGFCYMFGRGPNCCLLGHVTGLSFCLYIKKSFYAIFSIYSTFKSACLRLY